MSQEKSEFIICSEIKFKDYKHFSSRISEKWQLAKMLSKSQRPGSGRAPPWELNSSIHFLPYFEENRIYIKKVADTFVIYDKLDSFVFQIIWFILTVGNNFNESSSYCVSDWARHLMTH